MVCIYTKDTQKSFTNNKPGEQIFAGKTYFKNSKGKTVFIESWSDSYLGIDPQTNLKNLFISSRIVINCIPELNGTYISNYDINENFENGKQKKLVVYYTGVTNNLRVKVTYIDTWTKVSIERAN